MDGDDMEDGMPKTDDIKQTAVEYFQLFANITMTGEKKVLMAIYKNSKDFTMHMRVLQRDF